MSLKTKERVTISFNELRDNFKKYAEMISKKQADVFIVHRKKDGSFEIYQLSLAELG